MGEAKGLDTCVHYGPSSLDHRTLAKSPNLPIEFLRGCGLPELFIENVPLLFHHATALVFDSCFIRHSTRDKEFVTRLYADLQDAEVRCYYARRDLKAGSKLYPQLKDAIYSHDRTLLVISERSMSAPWVEREIFVAKKREEEQKRDVLFRVSLVGFEAIQSWECVHSITSISIERLRPGVALTG